MEKMNEQLKRYGFTDPRGGALGVHHSFQTQEAAQAGGVKSRVVIQQSQLHIFLLPCKTPVGDGVGAAAAVAAKGQVARLVHLLAAAGHNGAGAAQACAEQRRSMVAVQVEQAVVRRQRAACHPHGNRLPR